MVCIWKEGTSNEIMNFLSLFDVHDFWDGKHYYGIYWDMI